MPLGQVRGQVEFDGVGFGYEPGQWAGRDVCLRVAPGEKIALVGPTGCGKSTLMNLLLRFYDPRSGEIRLDGVPLSRLSLADLRRQIGIVPQETALFRATLADIERRWEPFGFVRVHRQYVANLSRAVEMRPLFGGTAELVFADGQSVPIARRHVTELGRRLGV